MRKRKITIGAVLVLLFAAAALRITSTRDERSTADGRPEQRVAVRTANPEVGTLRVTRKFTGELTGSDQAVIYSEAPGRLHSYLVREGEEVKKDQVIALVDREMTGMDFEQLRVRSPIDGTVTRLYLGRGDTVNQQTPLAVAARLDKMKASFHVPERDLQFVNTENTVSMRVTAYPQRTFSGEVSRVSLSLERASRSAYAESLFDNPRGELRPGMFAELEVISRVLSGAVILPDRAVLRGPAGDSSFVFLYEDGTAVRRDIQTGYRQNDSVQIVSGLSPDDRVIVEGQFFLEDGQAVRETAR